MKKTFLILLTILGLSQITKADTIAYWHIYYNMTKIREFNITGTHEIIIRLDRIKSSDSITVIYFRDTPCSECSTFLTVDHKILTSKGKGTFNPISFSLTDLIEYKKSSNKNFFDIFYYEVQNRNVLYKENIFRIKLE
jgi:hypothetical protein